jgi:hypothetical protein
MSQYSSGLNGPCSILGSGKICLFSTTSKPSLRPTQPGTLSQGEKPQGSEAEVKNGGAIPPLPHVSSWHSTWTN